MSALLKGRAFDVYDRLSVDDYEKRKDALLRYRSVDLERSFAMRSRKSPKRLYSLVVDLGHIIING